MFNKSLLVLTLISLGLVSALHATEKLQRVVIDWQQCAWVANNDGTVFPGEISPLLGRMTYLVTPQKHLRYMSAEVKIPQPFSATTTSIS
jgi:hypothetical protein